MIRVVFDTVVFVRGLINPYSVCGRIVFEHSQKYQLVVSRPLIVELLEVLRREELTRKFSSLAGFDLSRVLDIVSQAEAVEIPSIPSISRDSPDDKFVATAVAASAGYLVSEDQDLLVLGHHENIQILPCHQFVEVLAGAS